MSKKQNYAAPKVDKVVILPREAVLDLTSPTSNESLAIITILGTGTEDDSGVEW